MGDGQDRARVLGQVLLEPLHALGVEVVGRLVEQQQVGLLEQQLAQRDPAPLAAGQVGDRLVARRAAQRVHRLLDAAVELPALGVLDLLHQLALLGQQRVEVGVRLAHRGRDLLEPGQRSRAGRRPRPRRSRAPSWSRPAAAPAAAGRPWRPGASVASPLDALVEAGHDLQHARLAGAVRADHADLRAGQERQRDVVEDHLVAVRLAHLVHGVIRLVQRGLLLQEPDAGARREGRVAVGRLIEAGHDLQHARLAGAVRPDHADLGARQERQGDVVENHLVAVRLAHLVHRVDELSHCPSSLSTWSVRHAHAACGPSSSVPARRGPRTAAPGRTAAGRPRGAPGASAGRGQLVHLPRDRIHHASSSLSNPPVASPGSRSR